MTMIVRLLFVACLCLGPSHVLAQGSPHEQMLALSDEGFAAFSNGQYREAAQKFAAAYELEPDATLLKNEAIAWLKAGENDAAIDAASRFLIRDDTERADEVEVQRVWANAKLGLAAEAIENGTLDIAEQQIAEVEESEPDRVVTERIGLLRVEVAKQRKKEEEAAAAATREERERIAAQQEREARQRELDTQREIEAQRAAEARARAAAAEAEASRSKGRRTSRTVGFTLTGLGAGIVLGTVAYHLVALNWENTFQSLAETGGDAEQFERLRSRLNVARIALPVLYGVGAVTTGTGLVLVLRASRAGDGGDRELSMGIQVQGSF